MANNKKRVNKKLLAGLGTTIALGSATTMLGVAVSDQQDNNNNSINNKISTQNQENRAVSPNAGFGLTTSGVIIVAKNKNSANFLLETPNSYTTLPGRLAAMFKDGNGNKFFGILDQNNPNNVLAYDSDWTSSQRILSMYYVPYNDSIVALCTAGSTSVDVFLVTYNNVSSATGQLQCSVKTIVNYVCPDSQLLKNNAWGMVPVFEQNLNKNQSSQFLIFPRLMNDGRDLLYRKFYIYDTYDSSLSNMIITYTIDSQQQAIMSVGVLRNQRSDGINNIYSVVMQIERNGGSGTDTWTHYEYCVAQANGSADYSWNKGRRQYSQIFGNNSDSELFALSSNQAKADAVASQTQDVGLWTNGPSSVWMTFITNMHIPSAANKYHSAPIIAQVGIDTTISNSSGSENMFDLRIKPLLENQNITPNINNSARLFSGRFIQDAVLRLGGEGATNGKGGTPYVGIGARDIFSGSGMFYFMLKDSTCNTGRNIVVGNNDSLLKPLLIGTQSDSNSWDSDSNYYMSNGNQGTIDRYDAQQNQFTTGLSTLGMPITYYSNSDNLYSSDFLNTPINVLFGETNNLLEINTSNHDNNTNSYATYNYYTQPTNTLSGDCYDLGSLGDSTKPIKDVDAAYLIQKFNIECEPFWNSTFFSHAYFKNLLDNSVFTVKPDTVALNYGDGSVTFDLYVTRRFHETGTLNSVGLDQLKQNWWPGQRMGKYKISGFKTTPNTTCQLQNDLGNIQTDDGYWGRDMVTPSFYPEYNSGNNTFNNFTWWLKQMVWKKVCTPEAMFHNLLIQPTYNSQTWETDWGDFFKSFAVTGFNAPEGKITVNFTVSSKYVFDSRWPGQNTQFNNLISFTGFKPFKNTVLTSQTVTNSAWSNKNIPYINSDGLNYTGYKANGTDLLTETELKQYIWDNYFKSAYNDVSSGCSNQYIEGLPYNTYIKFFSGKSQATIRSENYELSARDIVFRNFQFKPAKGEFSVEVALDVWNNLTVADTLISWTNVSHFNNESNHSSAQNVSTAFDAIGKTWTFKGFRTDNITTEINTSATWNLDGVSNLLASSSYNNQYTRTSVRNGIYNCGKNNGYIKLPWWVNIDTLPSLEGGMGEISLDQLVTYDNAQGHATYKIHLKRNSWVANQDSGLVVNDPNKSWNINTSGFRTVQPITVDPAHFFDVSCITTAFQVFEPGGSANDFVNYLTSVEQRICEYVAQKDQEINSSGANTVEQWKQRIRFDYLIDSMDAGQSYTKDNLFGAISTLINSSTPHNLKQSLFSSTYTQNNSAIKLFVRLTDTDTNAINSLSGQTTDQNKGKNLTGLINTTNIQVHLSYDSWFRTLGREKGTTVVGGNDAESLAGSIVPPQASSGFLAGLSYTEVETYLKNIGYTFRYTWIDAQGQSQSSTSLPTNFTYSVPPQVNINITRQELSPLVIYSEVNSLECTVTLKLNVKVKVRADLRPFESMISSDQFRPERKIIQLQPSGVANAITMQNIKSQWIKFENSVYTSIANANTGIDVNKVKEIYELKYVVNGNTNAKLNCEQLFETMKNTFTQSATILNQMSYLRFYSPTYVNGFKIQVTIEPKMASDDFLLEITNGNLAIVNHGLNTCFDMSQFASMLQNNKATAGDGSTVDRLNGFTLPNTPVGTFDQFETYAKNNLGLKIRYSNDNRSWVYEKSAITSVQATDPAIYMQFSFDSSDSSTWGNVFNIKNFATGQTNIVSSNENEQWSSGVKIQLNLPRTIEVSQNSIQTFVNEIKASQWGGNTNNLTLNDSKVQTAINNFKQTVITENNLTGLVSADKLLVQFKVNASAAAQGNGTQFATYDSSFVNSVASSYTWQQFKNGVFARIILDNGQAPDQNYDSLTQTTTSDGNFVLNVNPFKIYDNTSGSNSFNEQVNPIKFWTSSVETQLSKITVQGSSTQRITLTYPDSFVQEGGCVYTDSSKRLIVQFTKDNVTDLTNAGYNSTSINWINTPPTSLNLDRKLFVRVINNYDDVVYGPASLSQAQIHQIDTSQIKPVIEVNSSVLSTYSIDGVVNVAYGNSFTNQFDFSVLTQREKEIIKQAISTEDGRSKVKLEYNLRLSNLDNNNNWMSLQELIAAIQSASENWSSENYGIIAFITGQCSIKARFVSIDPTFNLIDTISQNQDTIANGSLITTTNINTNINLASWVRALQSIKVDVVERPRTRAMVSLETKMLQPRKMPGQIGTSFLAGHTFDDIVTVLKKFGISIQFSITPDIATTWVNSISEIYEFDDSVNKVWMRIMPSNQRQIGVSATPSNLDQALIGPEGFKFAMNIAYPKTLTVQQEWIDAYVASIPVTGNTRFISINESKEQEFVNKITSFANNQPAQGDQAPNVWVEYRLGKTGQWRKRTIFEQYLAGLTTDATTNLIQMRLQVDPMYKKPETSEEPLYAISECITNISDEDLTNSAKIKIFVNENYELQANNVSIAGTNDQFVYNYHDLPVNASGSWTGANGLVVQWTTDRSATYNDPIEDNKWSSTPITTIDPSQRYLAIRIVAVGPYQYGAAYQWPSGIEAPTPASIHVVNTSEIKSKITVSNNVLANLTFNGTSTSIDVAALKQSEQSVIASANASADLQAKLVIKYQISSQANVWMTADELQAYLTQYAQDYANSTMSIMRFNTETWLTCTSITARFESNDPQFIVVDPNLTPQETEKGKVVNTSNLRTSIDFNKWYEVLTTQFVTLAPGSNQLHISGITPPVISGSKGESFMSGFTFEEIQTILSNLGITMQFQAPGSSTGDRWVALNEITSLNKANLLKMKFVVADQSLASTYDITINNQLSTNDNPVEITLKVDLPIGIVTTPADLSALSIEGTTINITNIEAIKAKAQEIVTATLNKNTADFGVDVSDAPLYIEFALGDPAQQISGTKEWYTIDEFQAALASSNVNYNTNLVRARFVMDPKNTKYEITDQTPQVISAQNNSADAPFKMYIHNGEYIANIANLHAIGSIDDFSIEGWDTWLASVPQGLSIQWSNQNVETQDQVTQWVDEKPATLDAYKKLWIRFVPKAGYVFEGSQSVDNPASIGYKIDTSQLTTILKLESAWLTSIVLGGNTKNLTIDEAPLWNSVNTAQQNPVEGLLEVQYTYDGINWFNKDSFIAKLVELDGALDEQNFILRRESIKARFNLNSSITSEKYSISIDGQLITNDNRDSFNQTLITSTTNSSVKGYINANKLTNFIAANFEIKGTSSRPKIIIKNREALNTALAPYASDNIFNILYSAQAGADGQGVFDLEHKLWIPGSGLINENGLIQQNVEISPEKFFALNLQNANADYQVYHNDTLQENGYILNISENVTVVQEITNPLVGKTISINFKDSNNQPIYYQSKGSFTLTVDGENKTLAEFIATCNLSESEKSALEIVYAVSDHELSVDEYNNLVSPSSITDYSAQSAWKALPTQSEIDANPEKLGLFVGQYITVAIRTKESFFNDKTNGFVMKDDNYTPTQPKRAAGFYVDVDTIQINWPSLKLYNILNPSKAPLDGFSVIENLSLIPDLNKNWVGVDLKLNLFDEFYNDANGNIIITDLNQKLVKRQSPQDDSAVTQEGYYSSQNGQPILDQQEQKIPYYIRKIDEKNSIPSFPIKNATVTRSAMLTEQIENSFAYTGDDINAFSLFANQDIEIEFVGKKGLSVGDEFDFYVNSSQNTKRPYKINGEIKFPINNQNRVIYNFDQTILDHLEYVNSIDPNEKPISGQSYIATDIVLNVTDANGQVHKVVGAKAIVNQIRTDFGSAVKAQITYIDGDTGTQQVIDGANVSQLKTLKNKDKIIVEIVAASNDWVFAQAPDPLVISVNGLFEKNIDQSLLKYLRVAQNGQFNGKGSFQIFVNDPFNDTVNDINTILLGYKFQIRVWNKDKQVKHDWTSSYDQIVDLENGDKVEWKLVSPNGQPVSEAYYNTVAKDFSPESTTYSFCQVNNVGNDKVAIVGQGIGQVPTDDTVYPENSGFTIADLIDETQAFPGISANEFEHVMNSMDFSYNGVNGAGNMVSSKNAQDVIVNLNPTPQVYADVQLPKYTLDFLIKNGMITFYRNNEQAVDGVGEFNWTQEFDKNGNYISAPGILKNGDKITAKYQDQFNTYIIQLPVVSGLEEHSDQMSLLSWVGIAIASVVTLGIFIGIYFGVKNRKLKKIK